MLNKTWSRNVFHNINIEWIQLEQPAVMTLQCEPLNGHLMHYTSVEYCPFLQAKPRGVWSDFVGCFHANISADLAYPKHVLLGTWLVTVLKNFPSNVWLWLFWFFHKKKDNGFALFLLYDTYLQMSMVRLAEIVVARKQSWKCNNLRCTSCHCVVTHGLQCCSRSNTPLVRW